MGLFAPLIGLPAMTFFDGRLTQPVIIPRNTVALNGRAYAIDLARYRHSSQETLRDGAVVQAESGDALFNANGAWSRYRYRWDGGGDQELADFTEDALEIRFDTSVGIDPWDMGELKLLRSTTERLSITGAGQVCVSNTRIYVSDGTDLKYSTDLVNWTTATAPGGTIQSMTTDGTDLYVGTTTVLKKYATGAPGTPVDFSTPVTGNIQLVAFTANRLLAGIGNLLREVGSTGTLTTVITHYQSGFVWTTAFAVGSRIYVGGYSGQRSEIYTLAVDSTGALVRGAEAAPMPVGELLRAGASNAGAVLLCTSKGVRQAAVGGDGTLTYGPLITGVGDTRSVTFDGRFAWCGWTSHPSGGRGTARLALDTAVDALQPAYASDVYAIGPTNPVVGVARFNGETVFLVDQDGLWSTTSTYLASGSLTSGRVFFGTVEPKALTEFKIGHAPLLTGQTITGEVFDDTGGDLGEVSQTEIGAMSVSVDLNGTQVRYANVTLSLSGPGTTTPTVFFWRLRAYPVPPPVVQWVVPLVISSSVQVNQGAGQEYRYNTLEEIELIRALYEGRTTVLYQEGERTFRVRVEAFEVQPVEWSEDGLYFQHVTLVRLVSA